MFFKPNYYMSRILVDFGSMSFSIVQYVVNLEGLGICFTTNSTNISTVMRIYFFSETPPRQPLTGFANTIAAIFLAFMFSKKVACLCFFTLGAYFFHNILYHRIAVSVNRRFLLTAGRGPCTR